MLEILTIVCAGVSAVFSMFSMFLFRFANRDKKGALLQKLEKIEQKRVDLATELLAKYNKEFGGIRATDSQKNILNEVIDNGK